MLLLIGGAAAVWMWITPTGTLSFTDDLDHVPSAYVDQAVQMEMESIFDYSKISIVSPRDKMKEDKDSSIPSEGGAQ